MYIKNNYIFIFRYKFFSTLNGLILSLDLLNIINLIFFKIWDWEIDKRKMKSDIRIESLGIFSHGISFMLKISNIQLLVTNNFSPTIGIVF